VTSALMFSRSKPCPPHGPVDIHVNNEGFYTVRCLVCRLEGPEREDALKARLAFDETRADGRRLT
jgi:hypothetical protein